MNGLSLALTASTLSLFLTDLGLDLKQIGILSIAATSYAFKYVWSPLVESIRIPILGRKIGHRKSWLLLVQCLLIASMLMGQINSNTSFAYIGLMTSPFLVDIGFSKAEIASIVKTFGMVAMLAGMGAAGILVSRIGIFKGAGFGHGAARLV